MNCSQIFRLLNEIYRNLNNFENIFLFCQNEKTPTNRSTGCSIVKWMDWHLAKWIKYNEWDIQHSRNCSLLSDMFSTVVSRQPPRLMGYVGCFVRWFIRSVFRYSWWFLQSDWNLPVDSAEIMMMILLTDDHSIFDLYIHLVCLFGILLFMTGDAALCVAVQLERGELSWHTSISLGSVN